jgi:hypothetical protein
VLAEQPRDVGAEAEEGGVAEGHDAGVAEDQVERHREQRDDGDLVEDEMASGEEEQRPGGGSPEQHLGAVPSALAPQAAPGPLGEGK